MSVLGGGALSYERGTPVQVKHLAGSARTRAGQALDQRVIMMVTDSGGGEPREQKMLKGHLPRVIYHQVY